MGGWCGNGRSGDGLIGPTSDPNKSIINLYNEATAVASGAEQIVVQYTVPLLAHLILTRVEFSGSNIATYRLYIGGTVQSLAHTWFNGPMSDAWDFTVPTLGGLLVSTGALIKVTAQHGRPAPGNFNATVKGILVLE